MNSKISSRRKRFLTVASKRVQKILDSFDTLSNCSNKANYEYTEDDIQKMLKVLKDKLKYLESAFSHNVQKSKNDFKF